MSTTIAPQPVLPALYAQAGLFRLTVDKYHEIIRTNILTLDHRVELLDGYLINKMPQNATHASCTQRLTRLLLRTTPTGWVVRIQLPITLAVSEPEPDAAVVRGTDSTFDNRHPNPGDFGILVEVANSSLALDRCEKGRLYAQAGIPVYWVIDVIDRIVEVYTSPNPTANPPVYNTRTDYAAADSVPLVLDGVPVASILVADLIP